MLSGLVQDWTRSGILDVVMNIVVMLPAIVIAITVHEFMHSYTAFRFGDKSQRISGRLTLSPLAHVDPIGLVMLVLAGFGWGKPVTVNESALRPKRWAGIAVSLAGPLSNLVMCFLFALIAGALFHFFPAVAELKYLTTLIMNFVYMNALLFLFNLLPIPPLDGFRVVKSLFSSPKNLSMWWQYERYGFLVLIGLSFLGVTSRILGTPIAFIVTNAFNLANAVFPF